MNPEYIQQLYDEEPVVTTYDPLHPPDLSDEADVRLQAWVAEFIAKAAEAAGDTTRPGIIPIGGPTVPTQIPEPRPTLRGLVQLTAVFDSPIDAMAVSELVRVITATFGSSVRIAVIGGEAPQ